MKYLVIVPGIGTMEWQTENDQMVCLESAKALGITDAWTTTVPDDDELDGSSFDPEC